MSSVRNKMENIRYVLPQNEHLNKHQFRNLRSENVNALVRQQLSIKDEDERHNAMGKIGDNDFDAYHRSLSHRSMEMGYRSSGQFVGTNFSANNVIRKRIINYPTIQLEDIQEVKSQDEKSSLAETRNNYN